MPSFFSVLLLVVSFQVISSVFASSDSVLRFQQIRDQERRIASLLSKQDKENPQCSPAQPCDQNKCKLSSGCFCSGFDIPGGLAVDKIPQMVSLTFQASVTVSTLSSYRSIFKRRKNPNKCPMTGTFFVMHQYTDYTFVYNLYAQRNELGVNGIDEKGSAIEWKDATEEDWEEEIGGARQIIAKLTNVSIDSIQGMRAPFLQMGGNNQLTAIQKVGLKYDSTRASGVYTSSPHLLWPYTYDYASTQDCPSGNCPNCSFPGIWEVPLLAFRCPDGKPVAIPSACANITTQSKAYQLLLDKFNTHYKSSNRAPMVISLDSAWMTTDYKFNATKQFLDYVGKLKDVYVVSAGKVIDWIKKPTPLASISDFQPWNCNETLNQCNVKNRCQYDEHRKFVPPGSPATYYLSACVDPCPRCYPWLKDPTGTSC